MAAATRSAERERASSSSGTFSAIVGQTGDMTRRQTFEDRAANARWPQRRRAGDDAYETILDSGRVLPVTKRGLEHDGSAEAVAVEDERRALRLLRTDMVEVAVDVIAVVRPGIDVAASAGRASVATKVEAVNCKPGRREWLDRVCVATRVITEAVDDGDRSPRSPAGRPAPGEELEAADAAEGALGLRGRCKVGRSQSVDR